MKATTAEFSLREFFAPDGNLFLRNLQPSPGFAFMAEGVPIPQFQREVELKSWAPRADGGQGVWSHAASGLEVEANYRRIPRTNTLELDGRIFNRSGQTIRNVNGPFPLCLSFDGAGLGQPRMLTVHGGGPTDACVPPPAFAVTETSGLRSLIGGREGGRSTETVMPYALVADEAGTCGLFLALEWPCRWIFCFGASAGRLNLLAHVAYTGFDLAPGESIPLPKVDLGFYSGDFSGGTNALRRHVAADVRRNAALPPVFYNHYYGFGGGEGAPSSAILRREAEVYAELGCEYFVVDAGWFKDGFRRGIGNWELEAEEFFPEGMAAFADHVRSLGMKFGSWLEPEFAMEGSDWARRHPDWFLRADGKRNYASGQRRFDDLLLRLDCPEVRGHVADFLERWVARYGIEWLRWDFNNVPAPFWEANEPENQWGRLQLGYGEGLLLLLDEFRARCPQVHLEACAGGGHRLDLGTLRRADSAWISDQAHDFNAVRRFQSGANRLFPGFGNSAYITHDHVFHPANLRSRMAGPLGFSEQSKHLTAETKSQLKREIANYKAQRHLLLKDYYPLFNPASLAEPDGWQFHDPETGEGFFMVFRCKSPGTQVQVKLRGLEEGVAYEFEDVDGGALSTCGGGEAFHVELAKPNGVAWHRYHRKG